MLWMMRTYLTAVNMPTTGKSILLAALHCTGCVIMLFVSFSVSSFESFIASWHGASLGSTIMCWSWINLALTSTSSTNIQYSDHCQFEFLSHQPFTFWCAMVQILYLPICTQDMRSITCIPAILGIHRHPPRLLWLGSRYQRRRSTAFTGDGIRFWQVESCFLWWMVPALIAGWDSLTLMI